METEGDRYQLYTRRAIMMAGGQALLATTLVGRMYYLGVVEAEQYTMLAEDNRIARRILAPTRGIIMDRNGSDIATNVRDYRVFLIPEQAKDVEETLQHLQLIYPLSPGQLRRINRQMQRQRNFLPVTIAENLSWEEFARINVDSPHLPGVQPDAGETRSYPNGQSTAHIVGYVGQVTPEDRQRDDDPVLQLPGFKIGQSGLEGAMDRTLRGHSGDAREEVNAYGRVIRELSRTNGIKGDDVVLTIDMNLQNFAARRLGNDSASVVVIDIASGDILAMTSVPSFDSNDFNLGLSVENWEALRNDPRNPLMNKSLAGQYPPGSTFKMAVALAALEAGVITPQERIRCNHSHQFGDRTFYCWKEGGHGPVDMVQAIAQSCDVFFWDIANRVGIDKINEVALRLGLGAPHDIGVPGQAAGLVPSRQWKRATTGRNWQAGETLNVGIGQGAMLTTPLQLAVMTARLANGDRAVKPRLIHAVGGDIQSREEFEPMAFNRRHLDIVREGMIGVHQAGGTAFAARLRGEGMSMAGKSGTSQVVRITTAQRQEGLDAALSDRPWNERDHALFVSYGPVENPRYAVAVVVEHGGGGSSVAAPIARDVMRETLRLDPSGKAAVIRKPDSEEVEA